MPSKEDLESRYSKFGATISQLSREYRVSNPVVRSWLIHYGIQRKSHKEASAEANGRRRNSPPPKDVLAKLYVYSTIEQLGATFSVTQDTVYQWLEIYGIPRKSLSEACRQGKQRAWEKMVPTKEEFLREYERTKNLTALQAVFDLSATSVKRLVREYEVETHKPWRSVAEIELMDRLQSLSDLKWDHSDKSTINPFELDMVCHEKRVAVEYCGLYWHSESTGQKSKDYHLKKLQRCLEKGYSLVTVFESDSTDSVVEAVKSKLGLNRKVHARHCSVREIGSVEARDFNDKHHAHGHHGSSVNLGLYSGGELAMVLSMGKSRFNAQYQWECIRMTCRGGLTVVGGASKLFSRFRELHDPSSIITYSDRRFGEGTVYLKCGFTRVEDTPPNYWYFHASDSSKVFSRVAFQKHKLKDMAGYDESLTEWEIMKSSRYDRVWDCGNAKYVWHK